MNEVHATPLNTMPQIFKTKWIEALRSGDYKQGHGSLRTPDNSYCCLGVLQHCITGDVESRYLGTCNMRVGNPLPSLEWLENYEITFKHDDEYFGNHTNPIFYVTELGNYVTASKLNDEYGYSFDQIANLIETNVKGI